MPRRDGLAQLGEAFGRRVLVVLGIAGGFDGGFDDELGRREVRLSCPEADDGTPCRLEGLGFGVHGEGGGFLDGGETS